MLHNASTSAGEMDVGTGPPYPAAGPMIYPGPHNLMAEGRDDMKQDRYAPGLSIGRGWAWLVVCNAGLMRG